MYLTMINRKKLIKKYLEFFESKNHKTIPSASLIPENDPTVLFTTAGMHPLVPYLLGQKHPLGKRIVNVQKCIRTTDIEEVGDSTHHTFFEMLGNWSLGDYWKKDAIEWSFEFLTKSLKIPEERLAVTCFKGQGKAPKDIESEKIWLSLGIPKERIVFLGKKDNWWGPAGETGPCGPDTEIFYWKSNSKKPPKNFNPKDENWVEIWNDVLMEYEQTKGVIKELKQPVYNLMPAKQKNVDTGMGVERTVAVLNGLEDNYLTDMWKPIIKEIEKISGRKYGKDKETTKAMRIIADHVKTSVFILGEGIVPINTEQGYVLRRLIRRAVRYGKELGMKSFTQEVAKPIFKIYDDYKEVEKNRDKILEELEKEEKRFLETLEKGLRQFKKMSLDKKISGTEAFLLYQSFGFPLEIIEEEAKKNKVKFNVKDFKETEKKHQKLSRISTKGKFHAGLADSSNQTTRYHTATHMLHKALKVILNNDVRQMGSNITQERLRFDFNFPRKLTDEEKKKIEDLMNKEIKKNHLVNYKEMPYTEAIKSSIFFFSSSVSFLGKLKSNLNLS